jgi:amidase
MQQFLGLLRPRACTTTDAFARLARLHQFRAEMFAFWQTYDAVLSPTCAVPAIPHGTSSEHWTAISYTMAYNLTGWHGAVVRAGRSSEGLPIGVQIVAQPWREDVALAIAHTSRRLLVAGNRRGSSLYARWPESDGV